METLEFKLNSCHLNTLWFLVFFFFNYTILLQQSSPLRMQEIQRNYVFVCYNLYCSTQQF